MNPNPRGQFSPSTSDPAKARLGFNIEELCRRIARGKSAAKNWSVGIHLTLRIASILLSSLGSVGVIVDRASTNLPGETGWGFWGSVVLLAFGILSQIANELQIAQQSADSRTLAEKCEVYDVILENVLNNDDPRTDVASLLVEVNALVIHERYNKVLPKMTPEIEKEAAIRATFLHTRNESHWQLAVRKQKGVVAPLREPPESSPGGSAAPPREET